MALRTGVRSFRRSFMFHGSGRVLLRGLSSGVRAETLAAASAPGHVLSIKFAPRSDLKKDHSTAVVLPVTEEEVSKGLPDVGSEFNVSLPALALKDFGGKPGAFHWFYPNNSENKNHPRLERVGVVGLGASARVGLRQMRTAAFTAVSKLRGLGLMEGGFVLPTPATSPLSQDLELATLAVEQALSVAVQSNHEFDKYRAKPAKKLRALSFYLDDTLMKSQYLDRLTRVHSMSEAVIFAREMANDRADVVTPAYMEQLARTVADTHKLNFRVMQHDELKAQGYNLITAVGQAATVPPRIVSLEYKGAGENVPTLALVGKGITFDSGGLNIKTAGMEEMHLDMSGSAAVLATIKALAQSRAPVNVVAVLALAENAINERAYKPHTILRSHCGSVEVGNTDAEGRLALADALQYVQKNFKPKQIIDIATLTGACRNALGEHCAGYFTLDSGLSQSIERAALLSNELVWRLPLHRHHAQMMDIDPSPYDRHYEQLQQQAVSSSSSSSSPSSSSSSSSSSSPSKPSGSGYSDIRSTAKSARGGGASTAATFLQHFVDESISFAHVDIAGPAMTSGPSEHIPKGGTGFGVGLLYTHAIQFAQSANK